MSSNNSSSSAWTLLGAIALGATAMYFLDPDRGRRRRHMAADKARHLARVKRNALETSVADTRNRLGGAWHVASAQFSKDGTCGPQLEARIRAALGRHCSHPRAIHVSCDEQRVTLTGDVLASEAADVIRSVRHVRGVHTVANELTMHSDADVPALQGHRHESHRMPGDWTPAAGLAAAIAGAGLALVGVTRRTPVGGLIGAVGAGIAAKGLHEMEGTHKYAANHNGK